MCVFANADGLGGKPFVQPAPKARGVLEWLCWSPGWPGLSPGAGGLRHLGGGSAERSAVGWGLGRRLLADRGAVGTLALPSIDFRES